MRKRYSAVKKFGTRLAQARRQAGLSQRALAKLIRLSHRMIAYYESQSDYPPTHHFEPICKALKISSDELLGLKNYKGEVKLEDWKLWRRFKKADKLSTHDKRALFSFLNALLAKNNHK